MKSVLVDDEQGWRWMVFDTDPAWPLVNRLPKTVTQIVLPKKSIITGEVVPVDAPDFTGYDRVEMTPELAAVIQRMIRLYEVSSFLARQ